MQSLTHHRNLHHLHDCLIHSPSRKIKKNEKKRKKMRGVERMVMVNISDATVEKMHMVDNSLKVI